MITHKTELSQSIDWLQYTTTQYDPEEGWNRDYEDSNYGHWGYTRSRVFRDGQIVMTNPKRPDMKTHVLMSAAVLAKLYQSYGVTPWDIIGRLADTDRVTRIDVCVDIMRGCLSFNALERQIRKKKAKTRARTSNRFRALGATGDTIYIGDPMSPKRLRIYDKASEQKIEGLQWTRVELQLRKPFAQVARFEIVADITSELTIPGLICGFVDFPDLPDWKRVFTGAPVLLKAPEAGRDSTTEWLMNVCAPSLARHQYKNPGFEILQQFLASYRAEYQQLLHKVD